MKRALLWTLAVAAAAGILLVAAVLIAARVINPNDYKPQLEKLVAEKTGRPLRVAGDVRLSLFPWVGVSFADLSLGNPPGFPDPGFLQVKAFEVRLKLWPLLFRQVEVGRLVIDEPRVALATLADGRVNWEFGAKREAPVGQPPPTAPTELPIRSLAAEEIRIRNGTVLLVDRRAKTERAVRRLDISLLDVSMERPLRLSLSADWEGKPVTLEGRLGPLGDFSRPAALPLELRAAAFGRLEAAVRGTIEEPLTAPRAALALEVKEFSLRGLLSDLGLGAPATQDPRALEKVSLRVELKADASSAALSGGRLLLDDTRAEFEARLSEFAKPRIEARLNADAIDLDRYLPPKPAAAKAGAAAPPAASGAGSSPAGPPPDFTALRRLLLDATVEIGRLTAAKARLETLQARIRAREGILTVDPFSFAGYEGKVSGKAVANVTGEVPRIESRLEASGLRMLPLLKDTAGKDFLEGTAQAEATLAMQGADAERIKASLSGAGRLRVEDGAIVGVDIADIARSAKAFLAAEAAPGPKPRTDFAELTVPFTLENGLFQTTQAEMKSPLLRLQAAGKADLVSERLDFRVEPKIVGTLKGQGDQRERSGVAVPILVSGTFDNPQFRPDLKSMVGDEVRKALDPSAPGGTAPLQEKGRDLLRRLTPARP